MVSANMAQLTVIALILLLCQGAQLLRCVWSNDTGQLMPLTPGPPKTLTATDAEECRAQCMSETTFLCAAINYKPSDRECQLLVENEQTTSVSTDNSWRYYIRPLCAGVWQPWIAMKGQYLSGSKYNATTTDNLETCTTRCLRDPPGSKECRSVLMSRSSSNNNCELHWVRVGDGVAKVENHPSWQYFSRPTWYLEFSKGATQANMTNQGIIGRSMFVFKEHKLPVSGYLVAWQYYYVIHADSCVRSYAVIMREVSAQQYKMISRTLLAPEEESVEGVRFQFIQNETIRVEKDDVLAILTDHNQANGRCEKNRVSVDENSGTDTLESGASTGYQLNHTRDFSTASYKKTTPSLKAYVAEYLSFNTSPTTYHTLSSTDGQVWLRLPPLPTREDSDVIGGYRVTCSTDDKLVQVVACNSYLVPVNTRDVLLTLPNVTRTFYAAVQMVRNFNGNERVETKFSPASRAFCPGRKRTEQVSVTESENPVVTGKVQLTVNFLHNFLTGDECAKEIKLSTSGYDSRYKAIDDDLERNFTLLLDQGATYDLTIYLKLADGTETKFWTGTHKSSGGPVSNGLGNKSESTTVIAAGVSVGVVVLIVLVIFLVVLGRRGAFQRHAQRVEGNATRSSDDEPALPVLAPVKHKAKLQPKPKPHHTADLEEGPLYANSTRILIDELFPRIQDEKVKCPEHPFEEEFKRLDKPNLSTAEGRTPQNAGKNRFKNITAIDHTRVKLQITDQQTSDYINASYISGYKNKRMFIAAQGPIENTIADFWRMIHQTKAKMVVMVTNLVEDAKVKCVQYWPEKGARQYDIFKVTLMEQQTFAFYIVRKLKYVVGDTRGVVTQFHYTQWFDKDVPSSAGLLSFRGRVKQKCETTTAPIIVHCSAGVGRTGTYIALDILLEEGRDARNGRNTVDIFACVNKLRAQRMSMVQVAGQYAFLYDMVSEALSCGDTTVTSSSFAQTLSKWQQRKENGLTVLREQFGKLNDTSGNIHGEMYTRGASAENSSKNRDCSILPSDWCRVTINHPEANRNGYINAVYCNGYQQKDGFIVTQVPMTSTTADYWRMVMEQQVTYIVYFNDCQAEKPFVPSDGQMITAGNIGVATLGTCSWNDGAGHFNDNTMAAEHVVECKDRKKVHRVTILEVKVAGNKLPSSQQLVSLSQKIEKYATSGTDVVGIQCRNGCRLSGLFLVAMNLFVRMRIEHEVDVVLEIKLARMSRPQFISTQEEFEALYKFVGYYLSEFAQYSNFTDIQPAPK